MKSRSDWRWYVARVGAMSPREVVWRALRAASLPFRRFTTHSNFSARWDDSGWNEVLQALAGTQPDDLATDAARIAGGNLEFWGRAVTTDLRQTNWQVDPLSGASPYGSSRHSIADPKAVWELHRQQHLFPLAAGAFVADQDDWREAAVLHLLDWIGRNPHQTGPGWQSGYETSHRLVGWAFSVPFLLDRMDPDELARVNESYAAQTTFVASRPSRYSSANNHRLAELVGLLAASVVGFSSAPWRSLWDELEREVVQQTYDDGGSREQAAGYFLYVMEILWCAGLLAAAREEDIGRIGERLRGMLRWLEALGRHDLEPPPVGDDAEDRLLRPDYFEPRRAAVIAGRVQALLDGKPTLAQVETFPEGASNVLGQSGYAVLRSGEIRVVFDIGELGFGTLAAHGHADALAVFVDVGGRTVLRDSGTGAYAPPEVREPFRSTAAHNTVVVDGVSQAESCGPHLWGKRFKVTLEAHELSDEIDYVRASHDGYRRMRSGAVHVRAVAFLKPATLIVFDRIRAQRSCEATLVWQKGLDAEPVSLEVQAKPDARQVNGRGPLSARYTWIDQARRSTWTASGREIVFATAIGLGNAPVRISGLVQENGVTRVELLHPHRTVITEDWTSPAPKIEA